MTGDHEREVIEQEALFRRVDFFRELDRVEIARLIGATEDVHFDAGTLIIREGERADSLYLLTRGDIEATVTTEAGERSVATIWAPSVFGELGLFLSQRSATVRALSEVHAWRLPRERFERLVRERPALGLAIARSLAGTIDRRGRASVGALPAVDERLQAVAAGPGIARRRRSRIIGAALAVVIPAVLWQLSPPPGLAEAGWHVVLVILGGAIAWLLEPVPEFAVALAMAVVWGLAGIAPPQVVFAGFASSSWLVAIAVLGLAAAMASSGLLFRVALLMLRVFPPTHRGQVLALILGGIAVTPLVPTVYGRVATAAPIALELSQALGYSMRTRASAALLFAAVIGNSFFSPIFLTGVVGNFLILELIPAAERARFDWLGWLSAALPAGLVIVIGSALVLFFLLPPETPPRTSAAVRRSQERALGPLSTREVVSLWALAVFVLGLLVQPLLRVDIAWIGLAGLLVAVAGGALDRQAFRSGLDWATLVFFGVLIGTGGVLKAGGVDRWVADLLSPMAEALGDPALVVMLLALVPIAVRLVLPMAPSAFLLVLTLVPAAPQLGLSGWVVGFVVFTTVLAWLVPSQYELLRIVREMIGADSFTQRQAALVGVGMTIVVLVAVAASLPYWRAIGLV